MPVKENFLLKVIYLFYYVLKMWKDQVVPNQYNND
jgi:hypothetical protein